MIAALRRIVYRLVALLGLEIDGFPNEGVAAFGVWVRRARKRVTVNPPYRGADAIRRCLELPVRTVLDVGSGGGQQAAIFAASGKQVTCVDLGTSVHAQEAHRDDSIRLIHGKFDELVIDERFELVWASHVLEHQSNVGDFLQRLITVCAESGWLCVTVPVCHRGMWGGHLTLWTPGLLAYNLALAGIDVSGAELMHGHREFSLLLQPRRVPLPRLSLDKGDIELLRGVLPSWCREGGDSWH